MTSLEQDTIPSGTYRQRLYLSWLTLRNLMAILKAGFSVGEMSHLIDGANAHRNQLRLPFREATEAQMLEDLPRMLREIKRSFGF